jgi:hypothetical protein
MQHKGCLPAVNAEVAKRDIFCNTQLIESREAKVTFPLLASFVPQR